MGIILDIFMVKAKFFLLFNLVEYYIIYILIKKLKKTYVSTCTFHSRISRRFILPLSSNSMFKKNVLK